MAFVVLPLYSGASRGSGVSCAAALWSSALRMSSQRVKKYSSAITTTASTVTHTVGERRVLSLPDALAGRVWLGGGASTEPPGDGGLTATATGGASGAARASAAGGAALGTAGAGAVLATTWANFEKKLSAIWRAVASMRREPIWASLPPTFASTT